MAIVFDKQTEFSNCKNRTMGDSQFPSTVRRLIHMIFACSGFAFFRAMSCASVVSRQLCAEPVAAGSWLEDQSGPQNFPRASDGAGVS